MASSPWHERAIPHTVLCRAGAFRVRNGLAAALRINYYAGAFSTESQPEDCKMGDKGGKKDKQKSQKQKDKKQQEENKKKQQKQQKTP